MAQRLSDKLRPQYGADTPMTDMVTRAPRTAGLDKSTVDQKADDEIDKVAPETPPEDRATLKATLKNQMRRLGMAEAFANLGQALAQYGAARVGKTGALKMGKVDFSPEQSLAMREFDSGLKDLQIREAAERRTSEASLAREAQVARDATNNLAQMERLTMQVGSAEKTAEEQRKNTLQIAKLNNTTREAIQKLSGAQAMSLEKQRHTGQMTRVDKEWGFRHKSEEDSRLHDAVKTQTNIEHDINKLEIQIKSRKAENKDTRAHENALANLRIQSSENIAEMQVGSRESMAKLDRELKKELQTGRFEFEDGMTDKKLKHDLQMTDRNTQARLTVLAQEYKEKGKLQISEQQYRTAAQEIEDEGQMKRLNIQLAARKESADLDRKATAFQGTLTRASAERRTKMTVDDQRAQKDIAAALRSQKAKTAIQKEMKTAAQQDIQTRISTVAKKLTQLGAARAKIMKDGASTEEDISGILSGTMAAAPNSYNRIMKAGTEGGVGGYTFDEDDALAALDREIQALTTRKAQYLKTQQGTRFTPTTPKTDDPDKAKKRKQVEEALRGLVE